MAGRRKKKTKGELAEMVEQLAEHRKTITFQNGDRVDIRFIPLPPEKRLAWERSMRLITAMLLEILADDANGQQPEIIV